MRTSIVASLAGALLLAPGAAAYAQESHLLRLTVDEGTSYSMILDHTQEMSMDLGAMGSQQMTNTSQMTARMTVTAADDSGLTLETVMERMTLEGRQGDRVLMEFDSDAPEEGNQEISRLLSAMVGHPFAMSLSRRGEIQEVTGFDAIMQELARSMGDDPQAKALFESLKQGLGDESMKTIMQSSMPVFPEGPVGPGDTWQHGGEMTNPILGAMSLSTEYTVLGAEEKAGRDCLKLGMEFSMSFGGESPFFQQLSAMAGGQFEVEAGEMAGEGVLWVALDSGLAVESEQTQTMAMTMTMAPQGGEPQTMKMDLEQRIRTHLEP